MAAKEGVVYIIDFIYFYLTITHWQTKEKGHGPRWCVSKDSMPTTSDTNICKTLHDQFRPGTLVLTRESIYGSP